MYWIRICINLCKFGSKVTVIEAFDRIAGREDEDISKSIKEILEKKGIEFLLGSKVKMF